MSLLRTTTVPGPLGTVLQPIVDVDGSGLRLFAVECLTRGPRGTKLENAAPLFEYVRQRGIECEMDRACISAALRNVAHQKSCRISVNVNPATLTASGDFVSHLLRESELCGIDSSRLILEIGEQAARTDTPSFQSALKSLRSAGVAVAIDDVGYGHANFRSILDCAPDFVKIDRYFVDHASDDPGKRAVIQSIMGLASFFGAQVVAEGVERREDHEVLRDMDIHLFQGFLFGGPPARPMPAWFETRRARRSTRY